MVAEPFLKCVLESKVFILKKCALILLLGDVEVNLSCRSVCRSILQLSEIFAKLIEDSNWMGNNEVYSSGRNAHRN